VSTYNPGITIGTAMEKIEGVRTTSTSKYPVDRMSATRVILLSTLPSIITLALLHILRSPYNPFRIPLFDDSPSLISGGDSIGIRWDAIHFTSIASRGYEYEQQLAFQPGWQGVLWLAGRIWRLVGGGGSLDSMSSGGTVLMVLLAGWRGVAIYE
jgi:phosphatidylinositol glycan class V